MRLCWQHKQPNQAVTMLCNGIFRFFSFSSPAHVHRKSSRFQASKRARSHKIGISIWMYFSATFSSHFTFTLISVNRIFLGLGPKNYGWIMNLNSSISKDFSRIYTEKESHINVNSKLVTFKLILSAIRFSNVGQTCPYSSALLFTYSNCIHANPSHMCLFSFLCFALLLAKLPFASWFVFVSLFFLSFCVHCRWYYDMHGKLRNTEQNDSKREKRFCFFVQWRQKCCYSTMKLRTYSIAYELI